MTASKDMNTSRPSAIHRPSSISTHSGSGRHARPHSHSLSAGSIGPAHRVTRRKSMTSNAAVSGSILKSGSSPRVPGFGPGLHASNGSAIDDTGFTKNSSAVADGPHLDNTAQEIRVHSKSRMRRASEGSRLSKGDSKRQSGGNELRCEKCGKGYKHSSCLTKHLWEHTPEWAYTSKLLISKHQQVQLLEAAAVLVNMNQDGPNADGSSGHSSASPAASGSSDPREEYLSSTDTTPPPQSAGGNGRNYFGQASRGKSSMSNALSKPSGFSESAPGPQYFSHYRQWSSDQRPATSSAAIAQGPYEDEDQADLAAAVGLLSCSYGTPTSGPMMLPADDVPPVPPLPARFLGQQLDNSPSSAMTPRANHGYVQARAQSGMEADDFERGNDRYIDERNVFRQSHCDDYDDDVFAMEE